MFESENENLSEIRSRLTEAKMLAGQDLPYTHIINEAKVSEKKALPQKISDSADFHSVCISADDIHPWPVRLGRKR